MKSIVCDAMILVRGVLGQRVRPLLEVNRDVVAFYVPELCFEEARRSLPAIAVKRRMNLAEMERVLERLKEVLVVIPDDEYLGFEAEARTCIQRQDQNDWHVVAASLLLDCPIWTEDRHFFGIGLRTWTTANIDRFLKSA